MTRSREDVLERNLEALLTRSYSPIEPSAAFRARMERELAPWIAEERTRPFELAPWLAAAGLLAATVLAWNAFRGSDSQPVVGRQPAPSSALVLQGEVALRELPGEAWRAATPEELLHGVDASAPDAGYELFTPEARGIALSDGAGVDVRVGPWSRASFEPGIDGSELRLRYFHEQAEVRSARRAALVRTEQGRVRLADAAVALREEDDGTVGDRAVPVLVHVLEGRATLDAGGGPLELEAPRRARMAGGRVDVLDEPLPAAADAGDEREPLPAPETAAPSPGEEEPTETIASTPTTSVLAGLVTDSADGAPVPRFEVTLLRAVDLPRVSWPVSRRFEGADGRFEWSGLEPGAYSVFVRSAERATWKAKGLFLAAGAREELAVALTAGATVRGFVVDRATALPIPGALVVSESDAPVQVLPLDPLHLPHEVRPRAITGPDGSFELAHLSAGTQQLRASGPEHGHARAQLELREGERADGLLFELDPGGAIEGRVEREGGQPWAGARVVASEYTGQTGGPMTFGTALTDAEGRYRLEPLAAAHYVVLVAPEEESSEHMAPDLAAVQVRAGETARADFLRATENARLEGRVLGPDGKPLPGATVNLTQAGSERFSDWRAATAREDGVFLLDDLEPGEHLVHVGAGSGIVYQDTVLLRAGEALRRDFQVEGRRLSGRVVDARGGEPVEGYILLLVPHVEPNGAETFPALERLVGKSWPGGGPRFEFPYLRPGRYDLVVLCVDGPHALQVVEDLAVTAAEDASVEVRLERGGALSARVVGPSGAPVAGARIELFDPHGRRLDLLEERTDSNGLARVERLEPGAWRVRASAPGVGAAEASVAIDPETERELVLVLAP